MSSHLFASSRSKSSNFKSFFCYRFLVFSLFILAVRSYFHPVSLMHPWKCSLHTHFFHDIQQQTYTHTNRGAQAHANEWTIKIDDKISSGCFSTANSRASIHVCDNFDVKERELQFANNANYDAFNHINKKNAFTCKTGPPLRHPS